MRSNTKILFCRLAVLRDGFVIRKSTKGLITMLVETAKFGKEEKAACTSLDVAETFEKEHKHVLRDIAKITEPRSGLSEEFIKRNFTADRYQDTTGRKLPCYQMTRDGFTILAMGYTGELAMKFKEAYIKQFNAMEAALNGRLIERQKGIAVRQALTGVIKQSGENERMRGHAYSTYTNCIYKVLFDRNAKQLREKYGIDAKDNLRDCFSTEELTAIQHMEYLVSGLIGSGCGYGEIKKFIEQTNCKRMLQE